MLGESGVYGQQPPRCGIRSYRRRRLRPTRRGLWREDRVGLLPEITHHRDAVGVEAAIRSMTRDAAWLSHSEDEIGSLEPGKLADFVVLGSDPRSVEPRAISDIEIHETWMDGKQVYAA